MRRRDNVVPLRASRKSEVRALLRDALEQAIERSGCQMQDAARWLDVDPSCLRRWLACETRIDVEAVLASVRLGPAFLAAMGWEDSERLDAA